MNELDEEEYIDEEVKPKHAGGRPSKYAAEFVRDISVQVLYEFYNDRQELLRKQIDRHAARGVDYVASMCDKAKYMDTITLSWLIALDHVKKATPNYLAELQFCAYCLRLEPPWSPEKRAKKPDSEAKLRAELFHHMTDWNYRTNCKRWVDGIKRVREDKCVELRIPPLIAHDDEDDFL